MSNRVEDLESQVAELQAAVNGLTEELVEMKERVRQLEDARETAAEESRVEIEASPSSGAEESGSAGSQTRTTSTDHHADVVETETSGDDASDASESGSEMIIPGEDDATAATAAPDGESDTEGDTSKSEGGNSTEEEEESDDIIVA